MKRPIVVFAVSLITGILIREWVPSLLAGIAVVILLCLAMYLIYTRLAVRSPFLLLALPFLVCGFVLHTIRSQALESMFKRWDGRSVVVTGYVLDEPVNGDGRTVFTLAAETVTEDGETTKLSGARIRVTLYDEDPPARLRYGAHASLSAKIAVPPGQRNIGGFDYARFLAARGISGTCGVNRSQLRILDGDRSFLLKSAGYAVRRGILDSLYGSMPEKEAQVVAGMLIGYTQDMPESMEESFRKAGLSHIMAVSGANLAFIILPLMWLLQRAGFNRRWASAVSLPIMLFYVFATGMEASVIRAAIMAGITLIGMIIWRQADFFCSVAASVIIILLSNTFMLFDPGFILSYAAVLSLVVFNKPVSDRLPRKMPGFLRDTLAGTFSAQLGVAPIIAGSFNSISIISLFSNMVIVPVTGILTALAAVLSILWFVARPVCGVLGAVVAFITDFILAVTEAISSLPWAEYKVATPGLALIVGYYLILLAFRYGLPRLGKKRAGPAAAVMLTIYGCFILAFLVPPGKLEIYFTDVGQGDSCLIRTPSGVNILIDGGGSLNDDEGGSYTGEKVVVPLLYDMKATDVDVMIATHGHADHINGLRSVMDAMPVRRLVIANTDDKEMSELIDYALKKGITIERADADDIIYSEGKLRLTALYPLEDKDRMPSTKTSSANELSLVTRLEYGEFSAIFTADIGESTEKLMLGRADLDCDLLKVAHHGSKYSSCEEFIESVSPAIAVISVGKNSYGHPSPLTEERLLDAGARLYKTIDHGGILVTVDLNNTEAALVQTVVR